MKSRSAQLVVAFLFGMFALKITKPLWAVVVGGTIVVEANEQGVCEIHTDMWRGLPWSSTRVSGSGGGRYSCGEENDTFERIVVRCHCKGSDKGM
jgi:hypothetical protein